RQALDRAVDDARRREDLGLVDLAVDQPENLFAGQQVDDPGDGIDRYVDAEDLIVEGGLLQAFERRIQSIEEEVGGREDGRPPAERQLARERIVLGVDEDLL